MTIIHPHISNVYPIYIYGRLYNQTLIIQGYNFNAVSMLVLSTAIYNEKLMVTSTFLIKNDTFIEVIIPPDTFRL